MKIFKFSVLSSVMVATFFGVAFFAPWIANDSSDPEALLPLVKYGPETADIFTTEILSPPDESHLMGTDYIGRDVFSRLIHGIRNSLFFSLVVVLVCMGMGMVMGGLMGFLGGWADLLLSRFMEVIGNFPIFLLQLTLLAFFDTSYKILFFVMIIAGWIPYCRFTRAEFLRLRNQEFVSAAEVVGNSKFRIFFRHLLPNSLTPVLIYFPFDLSSTIIVLGALSFLGFGEPVNVASVGELLKQAKDHFREAWWLAVFPGGLLFMLTLSLALFGSSLRDILDPRNSDERI